jgi:hypothetical protein
MTSHGTPALSFDPWSDIMILRRGEGWTTPSSLAYAKETLRIHADMLRSTVELNAPRLVDVVTNKTKIEFPMENRDARICGKTSISRDMGSREQERHIMTTMDQQHAPYRGSTIVNACGVLLPVAMETTSELAMRWASLLDRIGGLLDDERAIAGGERQVRTLTRAERTASLLAGIAGADYARVRTPIPGQTKPTLCLSSESGMEIDADADLDRHVGDREWRPTVVVYLSGMETGTVTLHHLIADLEPIDNPVEILTFLKDAEDRRMNDWKKESAERAETREGPTLGVQLQAPARPDGSAGRADVLARHAAALRSTAANLRLQGLKTLPTQNGTGNLRSAEGRSETKLEGVCIGSIVVNAIVTRRDMIVKTHMMDYDVEPAHETVVSVSALFETTEGSPGPDVLEGWADALDRVAAAARDSGSADAHQRARTMLERYMPFAAILGGMNGVPQVSVDAPMDDDEGPFVLTDVGRAMEDRASRHDPRWTPTIAMGHVASEPEVISVWPYCVVRPSVTDPIEILRILSDPVLADVQSDARDGTVA